MKLENLMYKSEEKVYTIGDLENLSASVLYGFDPSRPLGGIHVTPLSSSMSLPDFSQQFSCLDNYGKKNNFGSVDKESINETLKRYNEEKKEREGKEEYGDDWILHKAMELNKKSEPLKGNDFLSSGFQFHFHENEEIITGGKIKPYNGTKDDEIKLDNYKIAMGDLYAGLLGIKKIDPEE